VGDIVSESTGDFISVRLGDFVGISTLVPPSGSLTAANAWNLRGTAAGDAKEYDNCSTLIEAVSKAGKSFREVRHA